jgi:transcriptional regulator Rrf2-like protein
MPTALELLGDIRIFEAVPMMAKLHRLKTRNSATQGLRLLESRRGKHGGYLLARPPENTSIGQVARLIDGSAGTPCLCQPNCLLCSRSGTPGRGRGQYNLAGQLLSRSC